MAYSIHPVCYVTSLATRFWCWITYFTVWLAYLPYCNKLLFWRLWSLYKASVLTNGLRIGPETLLMWKCMCMIVKIGYKMSKFATKQNLLKGANVCLHCQSFVFNNISGYTFFCQNMIVQVHFCSFCHCKSLSNIYTY